MGQGLFSEQLEDRVVLYVCKGVEVAHTEESSLVNDGNLLAKAFGKVLRQNSKKGRKVLEVNDWNYVVLEQCVCICGALDSASAVGVCDLGHR